MKIRKTVAILADMRSCSDVVSKKAFFFLIINERQKIAVLLSEELTLKKNDTLVFHGHLLSQHQPQDLAFAKFSKPCLAVKCVSRNTCLNEEHNLAGWKHVQ